MSLDVKPSDWLKRKLKHSYNQPTLTPVRQIKANNHGCIPYQLEDYIHVKEILEKNIANKTKNAEKQNDPVKIEKIQNELAKLNRKIDETNERTNTKINEATQNVNIKSVSQTLAWVKVFTNPIDMTLILKDFYDENIIEAYCDVKERIAEALSDTPKKNNPAKNRQGNGVSDESIEEDPTENLIDTQGKVEDYQQIQKQQQQMLHYHQQQQMLYYHQQQAQFQLQNQQQRQQQLIKQHAQFQLQHQLIIH